MNGSGSEGCGGVRKNGVEPSEAVALAELITTECPNLRFAGLMTIGQPDYTSRPENFETLAKCRADVAAALGLDARAGGEHCKLTREMSIAIFRIRYLFFIKIALKQYFNYRIR